MNRYSATLQEVSNRGHAPASFLDELVAWGKTADPVCYAPNDNPRDLFALIRPVLGPKEGKWTDLDARRAALLEAMRVHAGYEASWKWSEGVDRSNRSSLSNIVREETGVFQVSFDSLLLGHRAMRPFAEEHGILEVHAFLEKMKSDHRLAMDYYARLVRVDITWAGPLVTGKILPWLRPAAAAEFQRLLAG